MVLFVLFEHASGYALFKSIAAEEIGAELDEVQDAVQDLAKFGKVLKLQAFQPFKTGANALENMTSISEGLLHDDLENFLEANVPRGKKSSKATVGVADARLGAAIQEKLVNCTVTAMGVVPELLRGIRLHFHKLVAGLEGSAAAKAQLGLGHSYSRAKVKFNVHRIDNMIIQSIALLDQLDKDINTFSMRMKEWYSYHFPELVKIVGDNQTYARVLLCIPSRKELTDEKVDELEEILSDSDKVKAILEAGRTSMGMDINPLDLINIQHFAKRVVSLVEYRKSLQDYLHKKMTSVAPNLSTLIGDQVGARLISHAGSLTNLAKYPASTVQILGAEKALFRALKTRGNTPKYGLIYHSSFIGRASAKNKGRISRYLANKCSIASRIDCFAEMQSAVFGEKLREQVEERLDFYETGKTPRKNIDVMKEAAAAVAAADVEPVEADVVKKKKGKKRKRAAAAEEEEEQTETTETEGKETAVETGDEVDAAKKKKKKKRESVGAVEEEVKSAKKKKKKKRESAVVVEEEEEILSPPKSAKKKKKRKSASAAED
ncbi:nucleolar protein 56-like [Oscarella lobularis]|uniref:nucleolar protein 56-like n=1 Tax=Oscarella lobularis TaxID=121494 RepID=UPI003313818A